MRQNRFNFNYSPNIGPEIHSLVDSVIPDVVHDEASDEPYVHSSMTTFSKSQTSEIYKSSSKIEILSLIIKLPRSVCNISPELITFSSYDKDDQRSLHS